MMCESQKVERGRGVDGAAQESLINFWGREKCRVTRSVTEFSFEADCRYIHSRLKELWAVMASFFHLLPVTATYFH